MHLDLLEQKQFLMLTHSHREQLLVEARSTKIAAVREGKKVQKKQFMSIKILTFTAQFWTLDA